MHHIYHTEAIILGSRNHGEAGKYYFLFTRDLGMIMATATGVRKMSSKLRYVLQDFAYVKVDLVKGKDLWRVTSASKTNELELLCARQETLVVFSNITRLLKRLLAGEDPNEYLFADVVHCLASLQKSESLEEARNIEVVTVLRILNNLGYIGEEKELSKLMSTPFDAELLFEAVKQRTKILSHVNKALKETHL